MGRRSLFDDTIEGGMGKVNAQQGLLLTSISRLPQTPTNPHCMCTPNPVLVEYLTPSAGAGLAGLDEMLL